MKYSLSIAEHEELGYNGVVIEGMRDYFEPATGLQVAHDLLEHPTKPNHCGFCDELMALGGMMYLRMANGYGKYRPMGVEDILSDLYSLASAYDGDRFVDEHSGSIHVKDEWIMETIDSAIARLPEFYTAETDETLEFNPDNVKSWMVKGYQLAAKRFNGLDSYTLAHGLFKEIDETVDQWLSRSEQWETADLYVNLSDYSCKLVETYQEEY
jgi:hypothetical protein